MIRVLVVDDHGILRQGLERLLATAPDIELVGMAGDGREAIELAERLKPDVILMDLWMPGVDGVEATRSIVGADPEVRVVVLTSFGDEPRILEALRAGAHGYLLKHIDPDALLDAIRSAGAGDSPLDPRAGRVLLEQRRPRRSTPAQAHRARARSARARRPGPGQQADRPAVGNRRTNGEGPPDQHLPAPSVPSG